MLIELIHRLFDREEQPKERDKFYVSEVNNCPVAIFYSFKNVRKAKLGPQAYLRFSHGKYSHNRIMATLFSLGIVCASEIDIPDNQLFSGRADAIVDLDGKLYVVEIKEVSRFKFQSDKPDIQHVMQLQLYLHYFNLDKGILLIENKDTQELREFAIEKDPYLIKKIINEFMKLKLLINDNQEPERPRGLPKWKCDFCSYREICDKKVSE